MPAEKKPTLDALSRSPSDSVDLAEFLAANKLHPPGWLDAVNRVASPQRGQSASAASTSALTSVIANNSSNTLVITQNCGSTLNEHTPATSRYPADVTAMGSPIPVDTDDSDANIQHLIARLGPHGDASTNEAVAAGGPMHRAAPPPPPTPAGMAPRTAPPPSSQPIAGVSALKSSTHNGVEGAACKSTASNSIFNNVGIVAAQPVLPSAQASSLHLSGSINGFENSPFGGSRNVTGSAEQTTTQLRHCDPHDTTLATDSSPRPTTYSSALMQALSRMEGAAVLTSQWSSTTHPSPTFTSHDEGEGVHDDEINDNDTGGSSAYPPDIYEEAMRAKVAKQQWIALERARQEVLEEARRRRDCPFAPQVSPYAARLQRPSSLRPENRVQSEIIRRKQWLAKKQQQEVERELRECTFRPLTVRAAQLDRAALFPAGTAVFHHLYAEAEDRRAFETEIKPQLVQQAEGRVQPSPMGSERLAEVVGRLCSRSVVRANSGSAPRGDKAERVRAERNEEEEVVPTDTTPYATSFTDAGAAATAKQADPHQPLLSAVSKRIVAAQVAAGERDPNIVRHLYRQAERDALKDQLRLEIDEEKERVARAEQAMALVQDRRRLQQEYYRSVLAAKYRALSKYLSDTQHISYRATAPQPLGLLARAAFDLLSTEETEELLSAVEHCGKHKLREAEFVAVVFRYFAEQAVAPADTALLTKPPPASFVVGTGAANAKRVGSAPRTGGGSDGSTDGSPLNLPKVKREKPDMELIAQIRESRAQALEEWKRDHQRKRAVAEGVVTDEDYPFQPAPRRLIPYECRPDVVVPVKMTKSEALRRAYIAAHHQEATASTVAPATLKGSAATATIVSTPATEQASTARKLFSRLATSEGLSSERRRPFVAEPRTRSRSRASAGGLVATQERERSAAGTSASPVSHPVSRAASVGARGPSCSPPQPVQSTPSPSTTKSAAPAVAAPSSSSHFAGVAVSSTTKGQPRWSPSPPLQHQSRQQQQPPSPSPTVHSETVRLLAGVKPAALPCNARTNQPAVSSSLVSQIMQSTPEERARLGRELLLRQLREHQRRRSA